MPRKGWLPDGARVYNITTTNLRVFFEHRGWSCWAERRTRRNGEYWIGAATREPQLLTEWRVARKAALKALIKAVDAIEDERDQNMTNDQALRERDASGNPDASNLDGT